MKELFYHIQELPKTSAEICMHLVNYKITMFPRYKYHLELIEKHKKEYDICMPPQSTILVYGKQTDVSRNLLHPMELHQTTLNGYFILAHLSIPS